MASAQVLPNSTTSSKKQQQLEAGKRLLEEFRKKRAAAQKASATGEVHPADAERHEKHSLESRKVNGPDLGGIGASNGGGGFVDEEFGMKPDDYANRASRVLEDGIDSEEITAFLPPPLQDSESASNQPSSYKWDKVYTSNGEGPLNDFGIASFVTPQFSITDASPDRSFGIPLQIKSTDTGSLANGPTLSFSEDSSSEAGKSLTGMFKSNKPVDLTVDDGRVSSIFGRLTSESSQTLSSSESSSAGLSSDARSSSNHFLSSPNLSGWRSRSSFLDSINSSRISAASPSFNEPEKGKTSNSEVHVGAVATSASQNLNSFSATDNGGQLFKLGIEEHKNFFSTKQDEDFAALEQHIEDLTQEKFSLQRALETSRVLAESLASENSALTDSYNQQGASVHQLRSDMERLREDIKAQLVELESAKIEYASAQLECSAADERAKLLASEVIGLEEKALRLRSNELKLKRQLEKSEAELSSYKKRISSLEKERQDLQLTISALQEEKKVLQSKLRKASANGKIENVSSSAASSKETSTSTEDLSNMEDDITAAGADLGMPVTASHSGSDDSDSNLQPESTEFGLGGFSLSIPLDQMRSIQNIDALISELALEKEELIQALSAEVSQSSKLKELNKELSQRLEVQTQRLELLASKSMASDNVPVRPTDSRTMHDTTVYADEGDEVVERVLGWIMKLFPGGPSKRRTSRLI